MTWGNWQSQKSLFEILPVVKLCACRGGNTIGGGGELNKIGLYVTEELAKPKSLYLNFYPFFK